VLPRIGAIHTYFGNDTRIAMTTNHMTKILNRIDRIDPWIAIHTHWIDGPIRSMEWIVDPDPGL
jgi:hypothetical protein